MLRIRLPGGVIGEKETRVPGVARFKIGESTLLFLKQHSKGYFTIVGEAQGKYSLIKAEKDAESIFERNLDGLCLIETAASSKRTKEENRLTLNQLLRKIQEATPIHKLKN